MASCVPNRRASSAEPRDPAGQQVTDLSMGKLDEKMEVTLKLKSTLDEYPPNAMKGSQEDHNLFHAIHDPPGTGYPSRSWTWWNQQNSCFKWKNGTPFVLFTSRTKRITCSHSQSPTYQHRLNISLPSKQNTMSGAAQTVSVGSGASTAGLM